MLHVTKTNTLKKKSLINIYHVVSYVGIVGAPGKTQR